MHTNGNCYTLSAIPEIIQIRQKKIKRFHEKKNTRFNVISPGSYLSFYNSLDSPYLIPLVTYGIVLHMTL